MSDDDPYDYTSVPLETKELGVIIPRAQHEALMAAAKNILDELGDIPSCGCSKCQVRDALRAAGIPEGEPND